MGTIKKIFQHSPAFTLVEIVVVAGIMALFSLTLISVFLATVRSGGKAQLLQSGHREGDFALTRMAQVIRSALSVDCNGASATVTAADDSAIVFAAVADGDISRLASDSSKFLTGRLAEVTNLNFSCYAGRLGNQVVTITLELNTHPEGGGQAQEQFNQEFATSVSTRQY